MVVSILGGGGGGAKKKKKEGQIKNQEQGHAIRTQSTTNHNDFGYILFLNKRCLLEEI